MRVLFAIGCNQYIHADQLAGAEADAQRIFGALMRPEVGQYDETRSKLLLSPSLEQVRQCLSEVLFTDPQPETFTFFFAGHGGVSAGSFYMWLCDTSPKGQSMSALSLADLFRSINEASPRQSNIIIDACESGGLIEDLAALLKPQLLGDAGTPALTLVATSAQDQTSGETLAGGIGTNAILDCIEGRDFIQDSSSALDLVEIGLRVSRRLQDSGQNPVVWGLNLYGPPRFCRNPRYASDPMAPLRDFIQNWPIESDQSIKQNHDSLWAAYASVTDAWDQEKFSEVISSVLSSSTLEPQVVGNLIERLAATFLQRAAQSQDPFKSVQVAASLAVSLLPYVESETVAASAQRLVNQSCFALLKANASLIEDLSGDRYALLSDQGVGLGDLYQLPLRIAKVLGWAAAATVICQDDADRGEADVQFATLLRLILDHYCGSIVALSDAQAPFWCVTLARARKLGLLDDGEQLAGLIFRSLVECGGKLARCDLPPERALDYLLARHNDDYSDCPDLVERPVETLTVLLKAAALFGLEEIFDESLWKIDGIDFLAYMPDSYLHFCAPTMEGGQNLFWSIGHDVFRTSDFAATWPHSAPNPQSTLVATLAVLASLLYPDRQPWFLLGDEPVKCQANVQHATDDSLEL